MNTSELLQHIKTHVVTIAGCNGNAPEHVFYQVDDWNISHGSVDGEETITQNELFDLFPNETTEWTIKDEEVIKADPETGNLLCPKCGQVMTAFFNVRVSQFAKADETNGTEIAYDHNLAQQEGEPDLDVVVCSKCGFAVVPNSFMLDHAEFDARHPAEEWKL